jgi:hypothetical protein
MEGGLNDSVVSGDQVSLHADFTLDGIDLAFRPRSGTAVRT